MKILEGGVRLCLKLQTSHIASMFFETWLDKVKRMDFDKKQSGSGKTQWIEEMKEKNDK